MSPDGRQIVFATVPENGGDARLWLRPLAATVATEIPGTTGAPYPFWSADNRFDRLLCRWPTETRCRSRRQPARHLSGRIDGRGGLWLDDDTILFAAGSFAPLVRVNAAGGTPTPPSPHSPPTSVSHRFPMRLPGQQLLYFSKIAHPRKAARGWSRSTIPIATINFIRTSGAAEYLKGHLVYPEGTERPLSGNRATDGPARWPVHR